MRNDQELHQLFRARLPIATLPKDFADRLTKAVLDEVARLRQDTLVVKEDPDSCIEGATSFTPLTKSTKPSPFSYTAKIVAFFLFLNCLLWPLTQGCAFPATTPTKAANLTSADSPLVDTTLYQAKINLPFSRTGFTMHSTGPSLRLPPLAPIQPQLPILPFLPRVFVSKSRLTPLSTLHTDPTPINLHGPPTMAAEGPAATTLTIPYEPQSASQNAPSVTLPEPTPVPTEQEPAPTATAIPTTDLLISKPTPTPLVLTPTPILAIFEPTLTPIATSEMPVGATTDVPPVTPTLCLLPWQTDEPEAISIPTASAPLTTTP